VSTSGRTDVQVWADSVRPGIEVAAPALIDLLGSAWAESDHERRVRILDTCMAPSVQYSSPFASVTGTAAVSGLMGQIHTQYPGYLPTRVSGIDVHNNYARYEWAIQDRAGNRAVEGTNILAFQEPALIGSAIIFFGPVPRVTYTYRAG
jgi:hypothetical protein